jgi:hypothetical protein
VNSRRIRIRSTSSGMWFSFAGLSDTIASAAGRPRDVNRVTVTGRIGAPRAFCWYVRHLLRAVLVVRQAEIAQARMRLGSDVLRQGGREPRLADARFAREQHHLAFAGLRFRPPPQQQFEFFFPSYKLRDAARVESIETAFD